MILPITAYGHPTLRKVSEEIDKDYPSLHELIENMFETMHASDGIGLAAPQVDLPIRLFLIDATPYGEEFPEAKDFKKVFINAEIIEEGMDEDMMQEGCLSIPEIREEVSRPDWIRIQYYDENFNFHDEQYKGVLARIIQHEYDHIEGILFVDHLSSLKKTLLKRKLNDISKGNINVDYKMIFPSLKKRTVKN
ncbi:MAG: peptide deformylase [Bacteroidales bacterium]|nr:peptide deformylase [Bacteroidales bacterium]